ncbi:hypothetical protein [Helicobacter zhangjianzhongii]|nr:hypothetical protein [Helicobacter sp. XJK30-2]
MDRRARFTRSRVMIKGVCGCVIKRGFYFWAFSLSSRALHRVDSRIMA